jgi:hypothetical protein
MNYSDTVFCNNKDTGIHLMIVPLGYVSAFRGSRNYRGLGL